MHDHELKAETLDIRDLDVDELERRLEMAAGDPTVTPDWSVGVVVKR